MSAGTRRRRRLDDTARRPRSEPRRFPAAGDVLEQQVDGRPPFDVVIGNAPAVRLVYKGQPFDLRPHYKVDVARLVLE